MGQPQANEVETIWRNARLATMAPEGPGLATVDKGAVASRGGRIAFAGPEDDMPGAWRAKARVVDCDGRWVTPGLIDCHTHLVYGGNRAQEFEMRLAGVSYEDIARASGGIRATVEATSALSEEQLVEQSLPRLDALIGEGATTVEIKSGYGLVLDQERKQLHAARALAVHRKIEIV